MQASIIAASLSPVYGVEVFSGLGELCHAVSEFVGECLFFEIKKDSNHDILTMDGLKLLLVMILRMVMRGLVWLGTPCSSWVIISRSHARRARFREEGPAAANPRLRHYLDENNALGHITALIMKTAIDLVAFGFLSSQ